MATSILVIILVLAGFVLSRTRFVRRLNARRFMPAVYAAATIYFALRAYYAFAGHSRGWPHLLLSVMFLAGMLESVRASGILGRR